MLKKFVCILSTFLCVVFNCECAEIPSSDKLKIAFLMLEENFSLDNRAPAVFTHKAQMMDLADKTVNSVLKNYPDNLELVIKSIRTLYSHRGLLTIYQRLGRQTDNPEEKTKHYTKAMQAAERCLQLIDKEIGHYTKVSGIYRAVANLYADDSNPFQDLNESLRMRWPSLSLLFLL